MVTTQLPNNKPSILDKASVEVAKLYLKADYLAGGLLPGGYNPLDVARAKASYTLKVPDTSANPNPIPESVAGAHPPVDPNSGKPLFPSEPTHHGGSSGGGTRTLPGVPDVKPLPFLKDNTQPNLPLPSGTSMNTTGSTGRFFGNNQLNPNLLAQRQVENIQLASQQVKWTAFIPTYGRYGAYVTSDNKVYPILSKGGERYYTPEGYEKVPVTAISRKFNITDIQTGKTTTTSEEEAKRGAEYYANIETTPTPSTIQEATPPTQGLGLFPTTSSFDMSKEVGKVELRETIGGQPYTLPSYRVAPFGLSGLKEQATSFGSSAVQIVPTIFGGVSMLDKALVENYKARNPTNIILSGGATMPLYGKVIQQPTEYISLGLSKAIPKGFQENTNAILSNIPLVEMGVKTAASFTDVGLAFGIYKPVLSGARTTLKLNEPIIRAKPLAKPQGARITGFDIKHAEEGFMFYEKIKVPRRYQYVTTPTLEYFKQPLQKITYSKPMLLTQQSVAPIKVSPEGRIQQPAISMIKQVKPKPQSDFTYYQRLVGQGNIVELNRMKASNVAEEKQLNTLFGTKGTQILRQGESPFLAGARSIKLSRVRKTFSNGKLVSVGIKLPTPGKTTTTSIIAGLQRQVGSIGKVDVFQYRFVPRDITYPVEYPKSFPISRTKNLPITRGVSLIQNVPPEERVFNFGEIKITKVTDNTPGQIVTTKPRSTTQARNLLPQVVIRAASEAAIRQAPRGVAIKNLIGFNQPEVASIKTIAPPKVNSISKQAQIEQPRTNLQERAIQRESTRTILLPTFSLKETQRTGIATRLVPRLGQEQQTIAREVTRQETIPLQAQVPRLKTAQRQSEIPKLIALPASFTRHGGEITREPPVASLTIPSDEDALSKFTIGYIPEAKVKGQFITLGKPMTKGKALTVGARFADITLSRTFRITPTKAKVKKEVESLPQNLFKFRTFKQSKGRKIPLQNTFIEMSKYALEPNEQRIIQPLARAAKRKGGLGLF